MLLLQIFAGEAYEFINIFEVSYIFQKWHFFFVQK